MDDQNGSSWEDRATHLHDGPGSSKEDFPYSSVENQADMLCEELSAAKINPTQAAMFLRWHDEQLAATETRNQALIIGRVVGELLASENIPIDLHSIALAFGLDQALGITSEAQVARTLHCTRAAVCKCVSKWRDTLQYSVQKFTRSDTNRLNCSTAQKADHWRNRKSRSPINSYVSPSDACGKTKSLPGGDHNSHDAFLKLGLHKPCTAV